MGYGISNNVIYGHLLTPQQSQELMEHMQREFTRNKADVDMDDFEAEDFDEEEFDDLLAHFQLDSYNLSQGILIAEDTDSRCENTTFEPGYTHGFGVLLATKGYGGLSTPQDFQNKLNSGPTAQEIATYNTNCLPLLQAIGVTDPPALQVVSYMA